MEWPLGGRESLKTEFKPADALRDPASIAREAVGFLNAEGGEIWIGVGESGGVADSIEAIPDPEKKRDRLQDALVDLVEPSPMIGREVAVDVVRFPADPIQGLLRVRVSHGRRPPYALLRRTMRAYLKRTGSRIRPMTREELAAAFTQRSGEVDLATEVVRRLEADLQKWAEDGFAGLKVLVRAAAKVVLALERETLEPLLRNPRLTGNRPLGWNFTSNSAELRPFHPDGCRLGKEGSAQWMSIWARGDLEFSAALDRLLDEVEESPHVQIAPGRVARESARAPNPAAAAREAPEQLRSAMRATSGEPERPAPPATRPLPVRAFFSCESKSMRNFAANASPIFCFPATTERSKNGGTNNLYYAPTTKDRTYWKKRS